MVPSIRIITVFIALGVAVAGAAQEDIFVDASANNLIPQNSPQNGTPNGSAAFPFRTITQALELAREIRFGCPATHVLPSSPHTITVHVAPGTYVGTFSASHEPSQETFPIVLNVPNLRLQAATPDGTHVSTVLRPDTRQTRKQHMLVVTRTTAPASCHFPALFEMAGDFVSISGFYFDGVGADGTAPDRVNAEGSALVSIDGVTNFVAEENLFTHAGAFGMTARLSSGRIQNNLFTENRGVGLNVSGGSETFPARMQIIGNRMTDNGTFPTATTPNGFGGGVNLQGAAQTEGDLPNLFSAHPFGRIALPAFYDRTSHPELVPDKLDVSLVRNTAARNATFGIHIHGYIRDNYELNPDDPGAVMTANVTARLIENVSIQNGNYGVAVVAGQIKIDKVREHTLNIRVSFHKNAFAGNVSGDALFGFWRFAPSVSAAAASDLTFKFAHESTMTICGDVKQFSFDNRELDPFDNTPTNNTLTVNNVKLNATTCVPLQGCVFPLPPTSPGCT